MMQSHRRYAFRPSDKHAAASFVESLDVEILRGDLRDAYIDAVKFDTFFVANVRVSDLSVSWRRARESNHNSFLYIFVNRGLIEVSGSAAHWTSRSGGLCVVFPGTSPVDIQTFHPSEVVFFEIEEREISPLILNPENVGDVSSNSTVFRAAFHYLQTLAAQPANIESEWEESTILRNLTRDFARAVTSAVIRERPGADVYVMAQRIIANEYRDPSLTVQELARRCSVSRRTLARSFAERGQQPGAELRRARVKFVMEQLAASEFDLDDVARAGGFGSRASMERALRSFYGVTARQARGLHSADHHELHLATPLNIGPED